jgi:PTH1 family peptidyl-tRNA hydrolase
MKYLIACLGNIGGEYVNTRHNIGFNVAENLAADLEAGFTTQRLAQVAMAKYKSRTLVIIKPTTYMNLSGKAVQYWLKAENIPLENLLVVVDDIALPIGVLRMKTKGSHGGHNGLQNIIETLGTQEWSRLRFGIGDNFPRGQQVDYVLSQWTLQEMEIILTRIPVAVDMIKSFVSIGATRTMNLYNNK